MATTLRKQGTFLPVSHIAVPRQSWNEFLGAFSRRHYRWLVTLETHDHETGETVDTSYAPLQSVSLDLEDLRNPRVKVVVLVDNKVITHVLFRPSELMLSLSPGGQDESLRIESLHTSTTVRFRVPAYPETVDHLP